VMLVIKLAGSQHASDAFPGSVLTCVSVFLYSKRSRKLYYELIVEGTRLKQ